MANTPIRSNSTLKFKGLKHSTPPGRFRARIIVNEKVHNLGTFATQEDAALAYNKAAIEHYGDFALLNVIA